VKGVMIVGTTLLSGIGNIFFWLLPVRDDQFFCGRESFFHGLPAEHL
jgi:hypothetical protein